MAKSKKIQRNKRKRERFNRLHGDLPKNLSGGASRTAWAKGKRIPWKKS